jgi:3-oxoadipate enol-lactonase
VYYEMEGPNLKKWQGDQEGFIFMLIGSTADLRKTADRQYVNLVATCMKVLTYDHRNTGQTTIKDEPCTMEDYADDAAALMEALVPEKLPCYVMGVSFGGMVAQHLALRHPKLIKKLVLCCAPTGGGGGAPFPIHEWYAPSVTIPERVIMRSEKANKERDEKWRDDPNNSQWKMVKAVLERDEKVGADEPLRVEGQTRQLDARKDHNTWDRMGELEMPVLCCGSPLDQICPVALVDNLAKAIGDNAETKLDFGWGHPFVAADEVAFPWINKWLRGIPTGQVWKVVGGADKGGILVRSGQDVASQQEKDRLSTGALVVQLALEGERLNYQLMEGTGPKTGWVSIRLKDKELLVKEG